MPAPSYQLVTTLILTTSTSYQLVTTLIQTTSTSYRLVTRLDSFAPGGPSRAAVAYILSAFSRLNRETTQPSNVRKNRPPRRRRRGRGRPPESLTVPLQQSAPPQFLWPPQPRNPSPPRKAKDKVRKSWRLNQSASILLNG